MSEAECDAILEELRGWNDDAAAHVLKFMLMVGQYVTTPEQLVSATQGVMASLREAFYKKAKEVVREKDVELAAYYEWEKTGNDDKEANYAAALEQLEEECIVCSDTTLCVTTCCGAPIHEDCLFKWLFKTRKCPHCIRVIFRTCDDDECECESDDEQ